MGSPVSPFLAEIFMSRFETELKKQPNFPKIWVRYVDDIFAIINKDFNINNFFQKLNSPHKTTKFTCESEVEDKLPFLDLLTKREGEKIKFEIIRQKTHTYRFIPKNSNHSWQHKMAAWNSMVYRLFNIPMDKIDYDGELDLVIDIAEFNGYKKDFVLKLVRRHRWAKDFKKITTLAKESVDKKS